MRPAGSSARALASAASRAAAKPAAASPCFARSAASAIGRIVESPPDVFGIVEAALRAKHGDAAAGFAAAREAAEASARALLPAGRIELTLDEIYAALISNHPAFAAMPLAR